MKDLSWPQEPEWLRCTLASATYTHLQALLSQPWDLVSVLQQFASYSWANDYPIHACVLSTTKWHRLCDHGDWPAQILHPWNSPKEQEVLVMRQITAVTTSGILLHPFVTASAQVILTSFKYANLSASLPSWSSSEVTTPLHLILFSVPASPLFL